MLEQNALNEKKTLVAKLESICVMWGDARGQQGEWKTEKQPAIMDHIIGRS